MPTAPYVMPSTTNVGGSAMSGVTLWAAVGPVVAVVGLVLIVLGVRRRNRGKPF